MRNVSGKVVEKIKTHFVSVTFFFFKFVPFLRLYRKNLRAGQAIDDIMLILHCMLDTQGYKNTLTICSAYCFCTATMAAQMLLHIM